MTPLTPVHLEDDHVLLEPLHAAHAPALEAAAAGYIAAALAGQAEGRMLPFAVREQRNGEIVGSTRYYDFDPALPRVAIGYTRYSRRWQKIHLNTACKRRPDGTLRDTVCYPILASEGRT